MKILRETNVFFRSLLKFSLTSVYSQINSTRCVKQMYLFNKDVALGS